MLISCIVLAREKAKLSIEICSRWNIPLSLSPNYLKARAPASLFRDAKEARRVAMRRDANTTQGCGGRERGSRRPARRSYAGKSKEADSYQWYVCARIRISGEATPLKELVNLGGCTGCLGNQAYVFVKTRWFLFFCMHGYHLIINSTIDWLIRYRRYSLANGLAEIGSTYLRLWQNEIN